jgi:acid phosphatase family membrane protein YuiD
MSSFNTFNAWVALTGTVLDDSSPMLPQLQKLNDTRVILESNDIKITNLQHCFILINALPDSYSTVASTILAIIGTPNKDLRVSAQTIQDLILYHDDEGRRRSGASASLNINKMIAPIKKNGDKADKSKIKCYYCQKNGHKSNECRKKKRDAEEKENRK